ncbi:MAG: hypothetical protein ACYCV7_05095, partial [Acidimicrobiales bacterium]
MNEEVVVDPATSAGVADGVGIDDRGEEAGEPDNGGDFEDDDAGNRISGGTPLAVVTYLVKSIAGDPGAVVINTEERSGAVR